MSLIDAMFPDCGPNCNRCSLLCQRADAIDSAYASKFAFMLECLIVDYQGHWNQATELLDAYKAEWEKVNPTPPTFMGEPIPASRLERLKDMREGRKARGVT